MPRFFAHPPQGRDDSQQLRIEGGFSIPFILPPQGRDDFNPLEVNFWIDDLANQMIDDLGNEMVFSSG